MSGDSEKDDYSLKRLAAELRRRSDSLLVLGTGNDPYVVDVPFRREPAEWAADLYTKLDIRPGSHIRRIHYRCLDATGYQQGVRVIINRPNGRALMVASDFEALSEESAARAYHQSNYTRNFSQE